MNIPTLRFPEFNSEWKTSVIHDLYKTVSTNSYSRNDLNYISGSIKNIHYGDIHVKFNSHLKVCESILPFINENLNYKRYTTESYCANGDIILADASEDVKDIGKSIEILNISSEKVLAGLHTIHLKPISKAISEGFGGYLFRTQSVVKQIQKESQGAKVLGVSGKKILKLNLSYPPDEKEQQKIADFLQKADERIALLKEKKELLERYKKGVMQQIFSQQLRFKEDNGKDFPVWEESTLGEIGTTYSGLSGKAGDDFGDGLPYIQYKQIFDSSKLDVKKFGYVKINENEKQNQAKFGDIFFTTSSETPNEIGTSSVLLDNIEVVYLNSFCFGFRLKSLTIHNPEFYRFFFRSEKFRRNLVKLAQGSTRFNLSKTEFIKLTVKLPSKKEQDKISTFLTVLENNINSTSKSIEATENWKKGLLQQMFV